MEDIRLPAYLYHSSTSIVPTPSSLTPNWRQRLNDMTAAIANEPSNSTGAASNSNDPPDGRRIIDVDRDQTPPLSPLDSSDGEMPSSDALDEVDHIAVPPTTTDDQPENLTSQHETERPQANTASRMPSARIQVPPTSRTPGVSSTRQTATAHFVVSPSTLTDSPPDFDEYELPVSDEEETPSSASIIENEPHPSESQADSVHGANLASSMNEHEPPADSVHVANLASNMDENEPPFTPARYETPAEARERLKTAPKISASGVVAVPPISASEMPKSASKTEPKAKTYTHASASMPGLYWKPPAQNSDEEEW
ncbi:hypothetical protein CPB85DRAFT_1563376 [Mucidula mucida]|nr:hypothetical protein CPB85DRAFT_1563376 [Mucidula mucida]